MVPDVSPVAGGMRKLDHERDCSYDQQSAGSLLHIPYSIFHIPCSIFHETVVREEGTDAALSHALTIDFSTITLLPRSLAWNSWFSHALSHAANRLFVSSSTDRCEVHRTLVLFL